MPTKILCLFIAIYLFSNSAAQGVFEQRVIKDTTCTLLPDSVIRHLKGRWDWTNGRDTLFLYLLENTYVDTKNLLGFSENIYSLVGYWYYSRYKGLTLGSRELILPKPEDKGNMGNLFDIVVGRYWKSGIGLIDVQIGLASQSKVAIAQSMHMQIKFLDEKNLLLLYDGYGGERFWTVEQDIFYQYLIPSNILLRKNFSENRK